MMEKTMISGEDTKDKNGNWKKQEKTIIKIKCKYT